VDALDIVQHPTFGLGKVWMVAQWPNAESIYECKAEVEFGTGKVALATDEVKRLVVVEKGRKP
jgi:hypothetical protein